jgi:Tfp pilus assembly protein PilN
MKGRHVLRWLIASRDAHPFLFWLQMWLYLAAAVLGSLSIVEVFS